MAQSERELIVRVKLGALNVVQYPDRLSTYGTPSVAQAANNTVSTSTANSINPSSPSQIVSYANGFLLNPNPSIDAPYNTFIYGGLTNQTGFDLLSPPSDSQQLAFPFSSTYGSYLKTPTTQQTFSFTNGTQSSDLASAPFVPSRIGGQTTTTPLLTTYNFWGLVTNDGAFNNTSVTYQKGNNPIYASTWTYGQATQIADSSGQGAILINSLNNNPVFLRRLFYLRQDCLYDNEAVLVYPTSANINPVKFNQKNGQRVINPNENCGFMLSFDVISLGGASTQTGNSRGIKIKFGNLDSYQQSSTNSNYIEYYELVLTDSASPVLSFWHPKKQQFNQILLNGASLATGVNRVYVHFAGNNLIIGFGENTYVWNAIGSIEPNENEKFDLLYHKIPGGLTDPQQDSSIAVDFNNIQCNFKYSALAFQNIVPGEAPTTSVNFFDSNAQPYKKQFIHNTTVSASFLKKLSQSTRLNDYFHAKSLRLLERVSGTPQYIKKIQSSYGFSSELLLKDSTHDFASISFARDWRMQDPFAATYNNSDSWELNAIINNPNYDTLQSTDNALPANTSISVVFDSPVYSPVFLELNALTMPTSDIALTSNTQLSSSQSMQLQSMQLQSMQNDQTQINLLVPGTPSYNAALENPVFYFDWGDISDLIPNTGISITHSVDNTGIGNSTMSLTLNDLIFSNRGANILNFIENNLTVIQIAAGYPGDSLEDQVFFEGVILSCNTQRTPTSSTHSLSCQDWLSYVLNNTMTQTSMSLQGISMRDRLIIGNRLAGLESFLAFLNQEQQALPLTTDGSNSNPSDNDFILALNFRQGNASTKTAGNVLSTTIEVNAYCAQIITETLQFIVDDLAIPILYQNNRNENVPGTTNNVRAAAVVENRYLAKSDPNTYGRIRDNFQFLTTPQVNDAGNDSGQLILSLSDINIRDFHCMITNGISTQSNPQALFEGVYLMAQGLGSFPIYQVRSSDSYQTTQTDPALTDAWLYATALNRVVTFSFPGLATFSINLLDQINALDVNNESIMLPSVGGYAYGYVGFRKRFVDDQTQNTTAIQTPQDLQTRGDLWAQYIRKVVQNITFDSIVVKPLQHYNNFAINGFAGLDNYANQVNNIYFDRSEFTSFVYQQVRYNIQKDLNIITANIQGSLVPRINGTFDQTQ